MSAMKQELFSDLLESELDSILGYSCPSLAGEEKSCKWVWIAQLLLLWPNTKLQTAQKKLFIG